jgi:hypothetical protein
MNPDLIGQRRWSQAILQLSPAALAVRLTLAVLLCVLTWLCIRTSLMTERLKSVFRGMSPDNVPDALTGLVWQHPRMLLGLVAGIAVTGLAFLALSRMQRRAVLVAALATAILLGQWLVVTPKIYRTTMETLHRLVVEPSK